MSRLYAAENELMIEVGEGWKSVMEEKEKWTEDTAAANERRRINKRRRTSCRVAGFDY